MQNLLQFLFRNGVFLLFLVLEAFCIYLVVQTNDRQNQIYHKSADLMTGAVSKQMESIVDYWKLKAINDSLRQENAQLRSRLYNQGNQPTSWSNVDSMYEVLSAQVIKNSILSRNNYITLDAGASHGIEPGMAVISDQGPVGIVISTTRRYAKVMSLLHSNTMISASILGKGYFGSLVWRSANPTKMQLDAIPKHANLSGGDTIITSGYSHMFPPGIHIGVIDTFRLDGGDNFYSVTIDLRVDMSNLQNVYVVRNFHTEEQNELENLTDDE